ncbi:MAG TPA: hypothetical protein DCY35_02380 [Prolixibacteraceae bacterium]|nr:hypothetical protein [Prolixibacteraceae bacterium]
MFSFKRFVSLFLMGCLIIAISGCGNAEEKKKAAAEAQAAVEALNKAHSDLLAKANEEISAINKRVMDLNDKMKTTEKKLTEAQNKEIDDIEKLRASVNQRMHEIKNITSDDWETFKATFEKDIVDLKARLDTICNEL